MLSVEIRLVEKRFSRMSFNQRMPPVSPGAFLRRLYIIIKTTECMTNKRFNSLKKLILFFISIRKLFGNRHTLRAITLQPKKSESSGENGKQ